MALDDGTRTHLAQGATPAPYRSPHEHLERSPSDVLGFTAIGEPELMRATRRELQKMGRLVTDGDSRQSNGS